ncbi:hypothetical protein O181_009086 [Austropuccinia psidii MF-1]|uniref:Uncharacterized protein n=1 Tax=Austropuccinia psidii MF-1 TaxID=1389203 RepID=A0A9Q3BR35_9BASI|nr:hypothetical protein [Austropuccinia psidii MF-1]
MISKEPHVPLRGTRVSGKHSTKPARRMVHQPGRPILEAKRDPVLSLDLLIKPEVGRQSPYPNARTPGTQYAIGSRVHTMTSPSPPRLSRKSA